MTSTMVTVDDGMVWAEDSGGDGPPLVLLHPGTGDSRIWDPVLAALTAKYRVIRYDARASASRPRPASSSRCCATWWPCSTTTACGGRRSSGAARAGAVRSAARASIRAEDLELEDPPVFGRLGEISVPASLMVGDADYPPLVESNRQAGVLIPGCEFVLVPGMDHLPPLREPALVLDLITRTLDRAD